MNDLKEKIAAFQQMLDESHYIVFFGGAGVSICWYEPVVIRQYRLPIS